jgi:hypothetical protein
LQRIRQQSKETLVFLDDIAKRAENRYSLQVQKDYDNLSPELDLLDKLVMHIHVNIGLRKEQRDRQFIQRIEIFGIIFATVAVIVAISGSSDFPINSENAMEYTIGQWLNLYLHIPEAWLKVGISISLSLIGAVAIYLFVNLKSLKTTIWALFKKVKK